jgi:hypothetical protein
MAVSGQLSAAECRQNLNDNAVLPFIGKSSFCISANLPRDVLLGRCVRERYSSPLMPGRG